MWTTWVSRSTGRVGPVAAVLFSLAAGCLGYLFGTAAGWHTAGPLPDDRTVVATTRLALPGQPVAAGHDQPGRPAVRKALPGRLAARLAGRR
jgi:hypothetical protein